MHSSTHDLLKILRGVAVAIQASNHIQESAAEWLSKHTSARTNPYETIPLGIDSRSITIRLVLTVGKLRLRSRSGVAVHAAELDDIWQLIHGAITSCQPSEIRFTASRSAQGLIAVPICSIIEAGQISELIRLHIWLPDGERGMQDVGTHSHQAFAQSWILAGTGTDLSYDVVPVEQEHEATHAEYALQWTGSSAASKTYKTHQVSSTIANTGRLRKVTHTGRSEHSRDQSYSIPAGAYHQSDVRPDKFHATLFYFDASRGFIKDAGVVGPKDGQSYTQIRDSAAITAMMAAQLAQDIRSCEVPVPCDKIACALSHGDREALIAAYCRYHHGLALLQADQRTEAMVHLRPDDPALCPLHVFERYPSDQHRSYARTMTELMAELDDRAGASSGR